MQIISHLEKWVNLAETALFSVLKRQGNLTHSLICKAFASNTARSTLAPRFSSSCRKLQSDSAGKAELFQVEPFGCGMHVLLPAAERDGRNAALRHPVGV